MSPLEPHVRSSKTHLLAAWFPGAGFKRDAEVWYKEAREMCDVPFEAVKKSLVIFEFVRFYTFPSYYLQEEGTAEPSFTSDNLQRLKALGNADPVEEEIVKNCAAIVYIGE